MLYFAYGSNLSLTQMKRRCPRAVPIGRYLLRDSRLVFRGVADCIYEDGAKCWGGIWRITDQCLYALDRYEGVGSGMYRRELVPCTAFVGEQEFMLYAMNSTGIFPPSAAYLDGIRDGYRDFRIPMRHLNEAVRRSWDHKAPSHVERKRHRRSGRPVLAANPDAKQVSGK